MTLAPKSGKAGEAKRHARGFQRPAEAARARLKAAAAGHGFAEPEVLLRWPEIVGERLAGLCAPLRVTYPRDQGLAATLVVRAPGPRATEVAHLEARIVERVNQYYGYRAIARLKVTQATEPGTTGFAEGRAGFEGPPAAAGAAPSQPTAEAIARASRLTEGIRDAALREALTRMGAHVLTRGAT